MRLSIVYTQIFTTLGQPLLQEIRWGLFLFLLFLFLLLRESKVNSQFWTGLGVWEKRKNLEKEKQEERKFWPRLLKTERRVFSVWSAGMGWGCVRAVQTILEEIWEQKVRVCRIVGLCVNYKRNPLTFWLFAATSLNLKLMVYRVDTTV